MVSFHILAQVVHGLHSTFVSGISWSTLGSILFSGVVFPNSGHLALALLPEIRLIRAVMMHVARLPAFEATSIRASRVWAIHLHVPLSAAIEATVRQQSNVGWQRLV